MHTHHAIDYIEFTVRDMDASQRLVTEAFGWNFGRRFHFADPNGNELAVWSEK